MYLTPPVAPIHPKVSVLHGDTRTDNYFWLREKTNPAVLEYLAAENAYTAAMMRPEEALQEQLYREILGRVKETDLSVPVRQGDYFYYTRTEKGRQYTIYCRKRLSLEADEELLLDANALAEGHDYFRVGVFEPSPNHELLAYSSDFDGDEVYTIRVKDLRTGGLLPDSIAGASAALVWANDNRTFFYATLDAAKRPYKVFRHSLGAPADVLVYHEPDERFEVDLAKSKSRAFLFIDSFSHVTSEYRYLPADAPEGDFRVMIPRVQGVEYDAAHHGDHFYIRINDAGPNFRLVRTPVDAPPLDQAVEVRPHRASVMIESVDAFRDHLMLEERDNGLRQIELETLSTGDRHRVEFPEPVYSVTLATNPEFDTPTLRFAYTSLITPLSIFDYDMERRTRELRKQTDVLGGYDSTQYRSERIFATAPDGVRVPISLVYKNGFQRDGHGAALLYGYGAYGHSSEPAFAPERLSLLDRGFVYAIAHVRGGSEMGRPWYDDGKLLHKKNSFTDFVACAEHLAGEGYTSAGRLAILGGSAGGLLMGAVTNLRPDLFHVAIAKVPFVDVLNTMLDASLPLTVTEYEEWGNPNEQSWYDYMRSYSPYDNVQPAAYPHMLITAGLNDPRVSYWEPAKWAARLRATGTDNKLLLLKTNMGAGHFGASGRYEKFRETAFELTA
ncbi:Protease 2 [Candidatus Sulfopaludibacter sp. SbA3]|nr:Protease 2 [Candidatus Sulfopaludibacter sp. SbA3]